MATLVSKTNGDFTAAGTWALCDPTSELDSESNSTTTSTSATASQSFTPGAITIDAIAVKLLSRSASPTGTFTIDLYNATAAAVVVNTTVTVNITDLPQRGGWVFFPTNGSVLLLAATNYQVRVLSSASGQVTLYRNATANNWSRQLRTTTTQAPVATDKIIVCGEHTGAGTGNNFTVTMNSTATTSYGLTTYPQSVHISKRGTLQFGAAASTAYYLRVQGFVSVKEGGTLNIGTVGTPIPSTSSAILEFDATAGANSGLFVDAGTFTAQGSALTYDRAYLAADASVGATSLTSDVSTGWILGDEIGIFPTARVGSETDLRALTANAVGTTLAVAATTYAHSGTGVYAGELVNLTRNVKIRGISSTLTGFVYCNNEAQTDCDWVEFKWLGHNSTANRRGVTTDQNTSGSANFNRCSFHSFASGNSVGVMTGTGQIANLTVQNCVLFNTGFINIYLSSANTLSAPNMTIDGCWMAGSSSYGILTALPNITFTNNRVSAVNICVYFNYGSQGYTNALGTIANNTVHSGGSGGGFYMLNSGPGQVTNTIARRIASYGTYLAGCSDVIMDGVVSDGCSSGGIYLDSNIRCILTNVSCNGGAGFSTAYGVYMSGVNVKCAIVNASFGNAVTHTSGDVVFTGMPTSGGVTFMNATFSSPTELSTNGAYSYGVEYSAQRYQGVAGSNRRVRWEGTLRRDTTITDVAPSSVRLTPTRSDFKLRGEPILVSVQSGQACTISVNVRKSVAGDGTAYNGSQPRLVVLANPSAGIQTNAVVATASGSAGVWETISGSTATVSEDCVLEFVVDCDGTQGWVNYDTPNALSYSVLGESWAWGTPYMAGSSTDLATFTDVPTDKVELGYAYKYNSSITNRTGTRRQPGTSDVKTGVLYGPSDSLTGTYDGSDRWTDPGVANVRSGISYKANSLTNNRTGDVVEPSAGTVKIGTAYGTLSSLTGTYDGSDRWTDPGESVVLEGIAYKANSTTNNKLGTLDLSSVATATAAAVWNTNLTGFTTPATAGYILKMVLTQITNLISLSWIRRR